MCVGVTGRIVRFEDPDRQAATVDFGGTQNIVNTAIVAGDDNPPAVGDWVLVHLGMALQRIEPAEAADTQKSYDDLMAQFDELAAERDHGPGR